MICVQLSGGKFKFICECDNCREIIIDTANACFTSPQEENEYMPVLHFCSKCTKLFLETAVGIVYTQSLASHIQEMS